MLLPLKKQHRTKNALIGLSLGIILLYFLPYFILGSDTPIKIHDNLDSVFVNAKVLLDSGQLFASSLNNIPQYDIPRLSFGSEFNIYYSFQYLLGPFWGYVFILLFMKIVGFFGMFLLLNKHFAKNETETYISILVSLAFALLPFYAFSVLSIAGLPLALYVFLNIRNNQSDYKDYLILGLLPFAASFIYSFVFFLFFIGLIFVYDLIKTRAINKRFLASMVFITTIFLATEYRIILSLFQEAFISHRTEYTIQYYGLAEALKRSYSNFIYGQYHAPSLHHMIVLPLSLMTIIGAFVKKQINNRLLLLLTCFVICLLISIFYGFWKFELIEPLRENVSLLKEFNLARFHWLHPLFWYLCFGLSLFIISENIKGQKVLTYAVFTIAILQVLFVGIKNHEVLISENKHGISYNAYFAPELFKEVENYIPTPKENYRVLSLGLSPTILAYNGFNTYDLYIQLYPLARKKEFRAATLNQLSKDKALLSYFDNWGNRLYLFAPEIGKNYLSPAKGLSISKIDIDKTALRQKSVQYLISKTPIDSGLIFLKKFTAPSSHWDIYLYKI